MEITMEMPRLGYHRGTRWVVQPLTVSPHGGESRLDGPPGHPARAPGCRGGPEAVVAVQLASTCLHAFRLRCRPFVLFMLMGFLLREGSDCSGVYRAAQKIAPAVRLESIPKSKQG